MPLTREARQALEAETVRSRPNRPGFHAPDTAAVLRHLGKLTEDLHRDNTHPDGARRIREDIDALLDRYYILLAFERGLPAA